MSEPSRFFPKTHQAVKNRLGLLSLDREINDPESVARVSAEILVNEFDAMPVLGRSTGIRGRLATAWHAAKAIPIVASTIKIIEWVKGLLPFA